MIVSIHQPNYLPWAGFIHKIAISDIYVVFDDVQLVRGKSFGIRTKIKTESGTKWLTVPVKNKSSLLKINQVEINNEINWNEKHWNSLKHNYAKAPFFSDFGQMIHDVLNKKLEKLVELNVSIIKLILRTLEIKTKVVLSSELNVSDTGTEKIIGIVKKLGSDQYLSGQGEGSKRYVSGKEDVFRKHGINLCIQKFEHPVYSQLHGDFIQNLSICDMIFNIGAEKTIQTLNLSK